jgi:hypothetical protein
VEEGCDPAGLEEKKEYEMFAIILIILGITACKLTELGLILFVDGVATAIAAGYHWRRERLWRTLLVGQQPACKVLTNLAGAGRIQQRLLARHLRISIAMTTHYSMFPLSSERGYALARRLTTRPNHIS